VSSVGGRLSGPVPRRVAPPAPPVGAVATGSAKRAGHPFAAPAVLACRGGRIRGPAASHLPNRTVLRPPTAGPRRAGFSLAELMIAIVILGLGLMIVASMFPIAWTKARDLAATNTAASAAQAAETTVRLLTRVSDSGDPVPSVPSFLGDHDGVTPTPNLDPWVHVLHGQNFSLNTPWPTATPQPAPLLGDFIAVGGGTADPDVNHPTPLPLVQVAFHDRVYPPLPVPPDGSNPGTFAAEANRWRDLLDQRRFSWSVLHKLDYDPAVPPTRASVRSFTVYYVTLRRGQPTNRYARQDGTTAAPYRVFGSPSSGHFPPADLGRAEDVIFPVPWRVEIELAAPPASPTGVPTEAYTNNQGKTNWLVTEMMPPGAVLIDEINGLVYRVEGRELDPANPDRAILTLDQEVPVDLLDDDDDSLTAPDVIRTVWVFPPAAERDSNGDLVAFIGPQPVAGIEVRTLTLTP